MVARRIVIGDIHGCAATFRRLVEDCLGLTKEDQLYLLGDYIDRGPASKETLDLLMSLDKEGYAVRPIRGNHEEMLLNAGKDPFMLRLWLVNGGQTTLASFKVDSPTLIPARYLHFIENLPYYLVLDKAILVHGSLNCNSSDPFADLETMLWGRGREPCPEKTGGRIVVTGHTPVDLATIRQSLSTKRIFLDNGCVYRAVFGLGCLVALDLDTLELFPQKNID